jgi:hypothetical protein
MKNKEFRRNVITTTVIFLVSFFALIIVSSLWNNRSGNNNLIGTIEALSTAVGAAAVFGAAFIAYQELSEIANTRYMDIADRLFGELNSPENVAARRRIFQNIKDDPEVGLKNLSQEDQDAMKMVLNSLDRVSFLTQSGWIPDEMVMPWMHPMIAKSWEKLEPYVLYERKRRNEPYYYKYAGRLAERCKQWRAENLSVDERKTKWVDNAL